MIFRFSPLPVYFVNSIWFEMGFREKLEALLRRLVRVKSLDLYSGKGPDDDEGSMPGPAAQVFDHARPGLAGAWAAAWVRACTWCPG